MEARLQGPIRRVVALAAERGALDAELVPGVTYLLFGALQEAALRIGAPGPASRREEIDRAVRFLLERLLGPAPSTE